MPEGARPRLEALLADFGGHVLAHDEANGTLELVAHGPEIDAFMDRLAEVGEIETVVRSGAMAMALGN
jgi:acetolactate synthase small subunit